MTTTATFSSEKVHMVDARILSFSIGHAHDRYFSSEDLISSEFKVHSEESLSPDEKLVRIILHFDVDALIQPAEDARKPEHITSIGSFHLGFSFVVDNFEELVQIPAAPQESPQIDLTLGRHLLAIAYSTARGMILVKTTGTVMEGAILPVIDPGDLMNKS